MPPERILIARRTHTWQEPPDPPPPPPWRRKPVMLATAALVVLALVGAIVFAVVRKSDNSAATGALQATGTATSGVAPTAVATPTTVAPLPTTTAASTTVAAAPAAAPVTTPATTPAATGTAATGTAAVAAGAAGSAAAPTPVTTTPPPTLPDGSWPPILAVFDVDKVTVSGSVPSQAAADRLAALGTAYSKTGAPVENDMVVDPRVPANVGVRVVELTSARFPAGSAIVMPDHAAELNRVVNVMNALPNLTALVIGHADQRGTSDDNMRLSRQRAQAVVDYLASQGINAERLSSKAVGADEPLTQDTSEAAYALNRRTEFVFYGLLVGT